jgi:hypothetical protein
MSIFISFNFETGEAIAKEISKTLRTQGMDAWWFDKPIPPDQLDPMIGLALANCTRCIVLLTKPQMSNWQMAEIVTIRHVFSTRLPAGMARECFIFARATDLAPKRELLPLFHGSEQIKFHSRKAAKLDFRFLGATPPALVPVTCGNGLRPRIICDSDFEPIPGQYLIHGDFMHYSGPTNERYCWIFLQDNRGRLYIQQPRPTVTHTKRWAAPNIVIGSKITGILLAAVDDSPQDCEHGVKPELRSNRRQEVDKILGDS